MKNKLKNAILFLKNCEIINLGKNSKSLIFLSICLVVGLLTGAIATHEMNIEFLHKLDFLFVTNFKENINIPISDIFTSSISQIFIVVILIELVTLSFWGIALIPFILFFRGLGLGFAAGYLYLIYGLKGIAYYILIMLPGIFFSSIGLILFSVNAFKLSIKFSKNMIPKCESENLFNEFKNHIKKSRAGFITLLLASLTDTCFTAMFSKFFNF